MVIQEQYYSPLPTLDYAIGKCTAGRGDTIYVCPGHAETLATASAVTFDVDGVEVVVLGLETTDLLLHFPLLLQVLLSLRITFQ